jgi:hypothetical protein
MGYNCISPALLTVSFRTKDYRDHVYAQTPAFRALLHLFGRRAGPMTVWALPFAVDSYTLLYARG